ncbi:MAG TPA: ceramidase domain-containing protein [Candidatus Hydrogenedentes bacterium]|jgi:hypothetical protein|nr:MAG: Ceramidase [Candidatus Hydrogenedentes bacterium ADurb.Bin101]HOC69167.1 ceramidase domain-containing protein [Candidatus Hydrogenedentota bacterium]HQN01394.1 ceramidase domain-containing protein [Candidatus Hydrogenedentota bacterium]
MKIKSKTFSSIPVRAHVVSWGLFLLTVLFFLVIFLVYKEEAVWSRWDEARELRDPSYGERIYPDSVFRTRANTWSNLAYVLVGIYVIVIGVMDWRNPAQKPAGYLRSRPALGILFGLACCYLGVGSGIFHASLTHWGQQLDVAAMYAPLVALIALNLDRLLPAWPLWGLAAVFASALLYVYKWSMSSSTVLPALILGVGCFMVVDRFRRDRRTEFRWGLFALISLVLAIAFRQLDVAGRFTGPDTWLQGHVLWHFLTAASLACAYSYYRSEIRVVTDRHEKNPVEDA